MRAWMILLLVVSALASCAPDESLPPERSSMSSSMDGTHFIPFSGAPDQIAQTKPIDSTMSPGGWSTQPVALFNPFGFAVGTRNGRIAIFNSHDSLQGMIDLGEHEVIDQLLSDPTAIYAVTVNGGIFAYTPEGKQLWKSALGATQSASAILAGNRLIAATGQQIIALDAKTGQQSWLRATSLHPVSLAASGDLVVAALSNNQAGLTDSILMLTTAGAARRGFATQGLRITSNVAICGKEKNVLAFGALGDVTGGRRAALVLQYSLGDQPKEISRHTVPYLVLNVGANENAVFSSGFRTLESDVVSGADAFSLLDTSTLWARRFTEPLAGALAVSNGNVYFTLSFTTEAIVASRALFYTLSAGSGRTVSERPIKGANAFVPGMPVPDEQGRFLVADRDKLVVYTLDRSTLKRVF